MPILAQPRWKIPKPAPEVMAGLPLVLLLSGAWLVSEKIFDGKNIALSLTILTVVNLLLAVFLLGRVRRFAIIILLVTYFFHLLYFLLFYFQQRSG